MAHRLASQIEFDQNPPDDPNIKTCRMHDIVDRYRRGTKS